MGTITRLSEDQGILEVKGLPWERRGFDKEPYACSVEIICRSHALKRTLEHVENVAPVGATVLVLGETGTGKELIAPGHS
jgi:transcriptional regulator with GAF, ATPase, and Fis domain